MEPNFTVLTASLRGVCSAEEEGEPVSVQTHQRDRVKSVKCVKPVVGPVAVLRFRVLHRHVNRCKTGPHLGVVSNNVVSDYICNTFLM